MKAHIWQVDAPHVCDAGRVEAQRLVERRGALPSKRGKHMRREDMRDGSREGLGKPRRCKQRVQGGTDCGG